MWILQLIDSARDLLDTELTAMAGESYQRAYGAMVSVQMLAELEEVIQYKLVPERQSTIRKMWWDRLQVYIFFTILGIFYFCFGGSLLFSDAGLSFMGFSGRISFIDYCCIRYLKFCFFYFLCEISCFWS